MTITRLLLTGPTTLWSGPPRPWIPANNAVALANLNSVEVFYNGTAQTTFPQPRSGFRMWATTLLPSAANDAAILSVDVGTAGRRAGGGAGSNYHFAMRDNFTLNIQLGPNHPVPFGAGPFGHHAVIDNMPLDPNGNVWVPAYINSGVFEMGLFQPVAAATGVSVSYIDFNVLWAGASGAWLAVGISILLPLLLPILGGMTLQHLNDAEFAQVRHIISSVCLRAGEATYPSIVLPEEREAVYKALSRPTYGV